MAMLHVILRKKPFDESQMYNRHRLIKCTKTLLQQNIEMRRDNRRNEIKDERLTCQIFGRSSLCLEAV